MTLNSGNLVVDQQMAVTFNGEAHRIPPTWRNLSIAATWTQDVTARNFTAAAVHEIGEYIILPSHAFVAGMPVQLTTTGTLPGGLSLATTYYVLVTDANRIQLAATSGGAAINLTDSGSGTHTITPVAHDATVLEANVNGTSNNFTLVGHGLVDEEPVELTTTDTLPGEFDLETTYYVIRTSADVFQLEATVDGGAIDFTGSGTGDITVTRTTPADTAAASAVYSVADTITIADHGLVDGQVGQVTTDDALPTGISAMTNYFVIVVDDDTIKLATSKANALAGTAVNITAQGAGTHTFTPGAVAGDLNVEVSNDGSLWFTIGSATAVSGNSTKHWEEVNVAYKFARLVWAASSTGGAALVNATIRGS